MRILQATSEFFPYSKTGGLADMVAGLSGALAGMGEDDTRGKLVHKFMVQLLQLDAKVDLWMILYKDA